MSAFLGPIHYWLYNKILLQQEFVDSITDYAENKLGNTDFKKTLDEKYGEMDLRPLGEIINPSDIHGWLQERVQMVEKKFAYSITELLKKDQGTLLADLEEIFYQIGKKKRAEVNEKYGTNDSYQIEEIYKELQDLLLDGMPCDHATSISESTSDYILIKRHTCVHHEYWDAIGGDVSKYYQLRDAFTKGYLEELNISYEQIDEDTFKLSK